MSNRPRTRQELYDRIRETSKDEFILEDMIRLGFWPAQSSAPQDAADDIRRRGEIERQMAALRTEQARLQNIEALKRELKRRRLLESKQKQKETKERRERERVERAANWTARKRREILHLGAEVSGGLKKGKPTEPAKLRALGLPIFEDASQIASAMGITVGELRFLAYSRRTASTSHYVRFSIPKKTGGLRLISAPMPRLKKAQHWVLENVLEKVSIESAAHGFVPGHSIVSNATPHLRAAVVVNLDLRDFFPTLHQRRIKGMFEGLGYGEEAATIFSLVTSEPQVDEVELDGRSYFVARGPRRLPQGSPASPAITNVVCRRLDKRLGGMAKRLGFAYSRYADDLTFSSPDKAAEVGKLLRRVRWIVRQEGFVEHEKKTRVLRRGRRQEVTGVVVNDKLGVERARLRQFRALLFQLEKDGPVGKRWGNREGAAVLASAVGFASYVAMVDPEKGKPLLERARAVATKHGWRPARRPPPRSPGGAPPSTGSAPPGGSPGGGTAAKPQPPPSKPPSAPPAAPEPAPDAPPGEQKKKKWWQIF